MNRAIDFLKVRGMEARIREFDCSSATVELAAAAIGCPPEQIAKTLSFAGKDGSILIVAAGDAKIDNSKFKAQYREKAVMLPREQVEALTGYPVGGVCPFAVKEGASVYLDISLKRFETVYTACGTDNCVIGLTLAELEQLSAHRGWVDVCKNWGPLR